MRTLILLPLVLATFASAATQFEAADAAFLHRESEASARRALELYRSAYARNPHDPQAGWRVAMACQFVGYRLTPSAHDKEELFREGRDAGLQAAALAPDCAPCHFWTAIDEALYGDTVGPFKMLFTLGEIREHLKKTIDLDPHYALGGPYRILALIDQKLPGILGGDDDRALGYLRIAVQIAPGEPLNYLFLAKLLKENFHRPQEALSAALTGSELLLATDAPIESRESLGELKAMIAALEKDGIKPSIPTAQSE